MSIQFGTPRVLSAQDVADVTVTIDEDLIAIETRLMVHELGAVEERVGNLKARILGLRRAAPV